MKTILVVDDSKTARLTLKRKLDVLDYQVEMADSGEAAIELLKQGTLVPDLIFMDVLMGNMSGYEAAKTILDMPMMQDVPVVMCTSKDSQEDRDEAARHGAKGFIIKPITDEALAETLQNLVVQRAPSSTPSAVPAPTPAAPQPVTAPQPVATPQPAAPAIVIGEELEALVRDMVENANLQRAEEAASQTVHALFSQQQAQIEDMLEGKISILSSSLGALHSAHDQLQAELAALRQTVHDQPAAAPASDVSEQMREHIQTQVLQELRDFEAQEHSKRAMHELDLQTRLENSLQDIAAQAAQRAAENLLNQMMGSHFAMMDERVQALGREVETIKSAPQASVSTPSAVDESALMQRMDALVEQRLHDLLPRMLETHTNQQLAAHITASDDKFQSIKQELSAGIQAVADALAAQQQASTQQAAMPQAIPQDWLDQLMDKQDALLRQRFNDWSTQMDEHLAQSERTVMQRVDEKIDELALLNASAQMARPSISADQPNAASSTKLTLGIAVLGVVLAVIALVV